MKRVLTGTGSFTSLRLLAGFLSVFTVSSSSLAMAAELTQSTHPTQAPAPTSAQTQNRQQHAEASIETLNSLIGAVIPTSVIPASSNQDTDFTLDCYGYNQATCGDMSKYNPTPYPGEGYWNVIRYKASAVRVFEVNGFAFMGGGSTTRRWTYDPANQILTYDNGHAQGTIERSSPLFKERVNMLLAFFRNAIKVKPNHALGQAIFELELALVEGVHSEVRNSSGELTEIRVRDSNGVVRHEFIMGKLTQSRTIEKIYDAKGKLITQKTRNKMTGTVINTVNFNRKPAQNIFSRGGVTLQSLLARFGIRARR